MVTSRCRPPAQTQSARHLATCPLLRRQRISRQLSAAETCPSGWRGSWRGSVRISCMAASRFPGPLRQLSGYVLVCGQGGQAPALVRPYMRQTRAALVRMGEDIGATRDCLAVTERRSIKQVYLNDFRRFTDVRKPAEPQGAPSPTSARTRGDNSSSRARKKGTQSSSDKQLSMRSTPSPSRPPFWRMARNTQPRAMLRGGSTYLPTRLSARC